MRRYLAAKRITKITKGNKFKDTQRRKIMRDKTTKKEVTP